MTFYAENCEFKNMIIELDNVELKNCSFNDDDILI
jgi:hypothetical protein